MHCLIIHLNILYFAFETRFYDTSLASMRKVKRRSPSWQNFSEKRFSRVTDLDMDDVFFVAQDREGKPTPSLSLSLFISLSVTLSFSGTAYNIQLESFNGRYHVVCLGAPFWLFDIRRSALSKYLKSKIRWIARDARFVSRRCISRFSWRGFLNNRANCWLERFVRD